MSGHNYVSNPNSLFEDDDVDDETFLKNSRVNPATGASSTNPFEQQQQAFEEKRREIENRTLDSSKRSLGLLIETEEVGKATAGELHKQREQLEKTSRQLDEIGETLRFSQRHLNGLKSVFGGLKNYLSGNRGMPGPPPPTAATSSSTSGTDYPSQSNGFDPTLLAEERYNSHPVNRLRSDDVVQVKSPTKSFEAQLEDNLGEMGDSLSRLKNLSLDLRSEIESQNDLLDNTIYKIEDVDIKMGKQNKEMNKLMSK